MHFASVFVSACVAALVCVQNIKHPGTSLRNWSLCLDASFVEGLSGCTILVGTWEMVFWGQFVAELGKANSHLTASHFTQYVVPPGGELWRTVE